MKKILGILTLLSCQFFFGQNTIAISSESVTVDSNFSHTIALENNEAVTAFQFDIVHNGDAVILSTGHSLSERSANHTLSVSNIDSNTIRVLVYSASNQLIAIGNGAVVNLNFISKNLPGTYAMTITNIVLSDVNGSAVTASGSNGQTTVLGPKYNLVTTAIDFGEVPIQSSPTRNITISNDGNEALVVSSYTLATPFSISTAFPITIATGSSVSLTVNIETATKQNVTKQAVFVTNDTDPLRELQNTSITANIYAVNEIYIGSGSGEINTDVTIPVSISNMEPFNGFQFDITLPSDITYVSNSVALSGREADHTIVGSMVNTNTLRILAYSSTNSNFNSATGEVLSFKLTPNVNSGTYPLTILSPIISNTALGNIESDSYSGAILINAPNLNLSNSNFSVGRVPITSQVVKNITLSNTGNANLIIDEVVYNSGSLTSTITTPLTISANQNTSKNLTFTPNVLGQFSSSISVRHNGAAEQNVIQVTADVFTPNYLLIEEKSIYINEDNTIKLVLSNNDDVKAIQFDINIPDGFVFDYQNATNEAVLDNFQFSSSDLGNGNFRFIIYTVSNSVIPSGTNPILNLPVFVNSTTALGDYDFAFSNIVISNTANQNAASEALETNVIHVIENSAPIAVDDKITIIKNSNITSIDVIANDTDVDADALTVTEVTYTGTGTVAISNNKIDYTPAVNFNGTETVSYTVSDGTLTDVGTLTITVTAVNDAPVAVDDTISLEQGNSNIVTLSATDADDDALTYLIVNQPAHGTVTLDGNQATYTSTDATYTGADSFTFAASDGNLTSNIAMITIDVTLDVLNYSLDNIKSYPNPFNEFYIIESIIPIKLEVYDINGKIILKKQLVPGKNKINGANLSRGYYIFKFKDKSKYSSKILIKD